MKLDVYREGRYLRAEVFTSDSIRIGTLPTLDVILEGDEVSQVHALIQRALDGDGFVISEFGGNVVRLNGISISKAKLRQGDRLGIGPFELVVSSEQAFEDGAITNDLSWGDPIFLLTKKKTAV